MILVVNAGNSVIETGLYNKEVQLAKALFSNHHAQTSHEYSYMLRNFISSEGYNPQKVEGAVIAPVNPTSSSAISCAVFMTCGVTPLYIGPGIRTGLDILLKDPAEMGADLLAVSVAALHKHKPPLIIVLIGATALVLIAINSKGQYLGGSLAPSPRLSLDALCKAAAYLPSMTIETPSRIIGTNTRDALSSGVVYGTAASVRGMVEMMIDKISEKPHNNVTTVITGSVAPAITPYIGIEAEYDASLMLDGLNILYHRNKRKQAI